MVGCFVYLQQAGSWFKYAISAAILTERQMRDVSASRTQFPCRTDPSRNALTRSEVVIAASPFPAPINVGFKRAELWRSGRSIYDIYYICDIN